MNYELAKELKGAGFPFKKDTYEAYAHVQGFMYELPTLSELIEACGKPFMLHVIEDGCQAFNDTHSDCSADGFGSTPLEAVARLWLALNKKS